MNSPFDYYGLKGEQVIHCSLWRDIPVKMNFFSGPCAKKRDNNGRHLNFPQEVQSPWIEVTDTIIWPGYAGLKWGQSG
jgi:hypothetical protein